MAFSYSDKNFTVIGNLCFVHIVMDGKKDSYDVPPAISDRMFYKSIAYSYPYMTSDYTIETGLSIISNDKITLSNVGEGYLIFYFPIDSNK